MAHKAPKKTNAAHKHQHRKRGHHKGRQPAPADSGAVPVALEIGWTMAVLFGQLQPGPECGDRLPTEHELPPDQRIELEVGRANSLLGRLGALLPASPSAVPGVPHVRSANGYAYGASAGPGVIPRQAGNAQVPDIDAFHLDLEKANYKILKWLARAGREFGLAYQLGRSLRDTANPPFQIPAGTELVPGTEAQSADIDGSATASREDEIRSRAAVIQAAKQAAELAAKQEAAKETQEKPDSLELTDDERKRISSEAEQQAQREFAVAARNAVATQLSRSRVTKLQEWLSTLAAHLPADSAGIVSASIGRWCDLSATIFDDRTPGSLRRFRAPSQWDVAFRLLNCLRPQGDAWLNLLIGAESSEGLLSPEGFVAAGEASLNRTIRIIRRIVIHYRLALAVLVLAVAGVFLIARGISGAGRAWTEIGTVVSALGVTAKGIGSTMARLSKDAEKPIFGLEKIDAMAWAVTTIPDDMKLNGRGVRALRRSGIPGSVPLGRV
jgi:hypothetical protein